MTQVISAHLVTFESIAELQEQNVQLRSALRALSDQRESEERQRTTQADAALKEQLTQALSELQDLKTSRIKHQEVIQAITKQVLEVPVIELQ
jgi:flagellar motility protein MotE (MotC chaperone)